MIILSSCLQKTGRHFVSFLTDATVSNGHSMALDGSFAMGVDVALDGSFAMGVDVTVHDSQTSFMIFCSFASDLRQGKVQSLHIIFQFRHHLFVCLFVCFQKK